MVLQMSEIRQSVGRLTSEYTYQYNRSRTSEREESHLVAWNHLCRTSRTHRQNKSDRISYSITLFTYRTRRHINQRQILRLAHVRRARRQLRNVSHHTVPYMDSRTPHEQVSEKLVRAGEYDDIVRHQMRGNLEEIGHIQL